MSYSSPLHLRFSPLVDRYIKYQFQSETKTLRSGRAYIAIIYFDVSMLACV